MQHTAITENNQLFSGNVYIFHAFDIGDDVDLEYLERMRSVTTVPQKVPKYFKNYHVPLAIELTNKTSESRCISCKIHSFGAMSLIYKVPFQDTLKNMRKNFSSIAEKYTEQSYTDARLVYKQIERAIGHPNFSQATSSYIMMQVNPQDDVVELSNFQKVHGDTIASILRFETETLSEYQISEMWESAIGYFRGDLIVVDTDAAFVYDDEYQDLTDLFEFANIQSLELRYFDRTLDEQLNAIYEGKVKQLSFRSYMPIIGSLVNDAVARLWKLKVDISVITERLESSIKLAGEPYIFEVYDELVENLDLKSWKDGIDRKLKIIESVQTSHQHKIETNREDMISVLILVLIFIELVIGILHYIK